MGDSCIYDRMEQCFHDCDNCPQKYRGDDCGAEYDPDEKYERGDQ